MNLLIYLMGRVRRAHAGCQAALVSSQSVHVKATSANLQNFFIFGFFTIIEIMMLRVGKDSPIDEQCSHGTPRLRYLKDFKGPKKMEGLEI